MNSHQNELRCQNFFELPQIDQNDYLYPLVLIPKNLIHISQIVLIFFHFLFKLLNFPSKGLSNT